jgi:predicted transcriptional regulator
MVDWLRVIAEINKRGRNNRQLADATGLTKDQICRIKQGVEPRWSDGQAILNEFESATGQPPPTRRTDG